MVELCCSHISYTDGDVALSVLSLHVDGGASYSAPPTALQGYLLPHCWHHPPLLRTGSGAGACPGMAANDQCLCSGGTREVPLPNGDSPGGIPAGVGGGCSVQL